jgi:general secretion pathway protein D
MTIKGCLAPAHAVLSACLLAACASSPPAPEPITHDQLAKLRAPGNFAHMAVKTTVTLHNGENLMTSPSVVQNPGQKASIELVREFRYPVDFKLPQLSLAKPGQKGAATPPQDAGVFPVTPTTPTRFEQKSPGVQITLSPRFDGALVLLTGEVVISEFAGFTDAAGEIVSHPIIASKENPVVITPNIVHLPMFREARTPLFVAALPGKTCAMQVMGLKGPIQMDFTCELVPEKK